MSPASSTLWSTRPARSASTPSASPRRIRSRRRRRDWRRFLPTAITATWTGWRRTRNGAAIPQVLWPEARSVIMLGMNYGPDDDPLAILAQRDRGAISVYAQGDDYHDLIKRRLKALARWLIAQRRRRGEGVRRHRAGDGEAAGASAPASAGRASTPIWCRANSAPGCFSARSSPRWNCRPTQPRPIIAARAAPASTSARPRPFRRPTGSMRGAASPI